MNANMVCNSINATSAPSDKLIVIWTMLQEMLKFGVSQSNLEVKVSGTSGPLCDQVGETIDHLLVSCVFSRQFWFYILQHFGLQAAAPQLDDHCFIAWWAGVSSRFSGQVQKGVNSIIILGSWLVWKHHNYCVFDGGTPNLSRVVSTFREDVQQGLEEFLISLP